jgi:hypothetical protein
MNQNDNIFLKYFIIEVIAITLVLGFIFVATLSIVYQPSINEVSLFFNETNMRSMISFSQNYTNTSLNVSPDNILSQIVTSASTFSPVLSLLGFLGGFIFVFFSIKEGTFSKSDSRGFFMDLWGY